MDGILSVYNYLDNSDTSVFDYQLNGPKGTTIEMFGRYGIFIDDRAIETSAEHNTIVAHEAGHVATGTTHNLYSPFQLVARCEYKANKWAIKKLIPVDELESAISDGYRDIWHLADHFNVTKEFMELALTLYRDRMELLNTSKPNCETA